MSSQKDSEQNIALPAFPVRWFMLFRRHPLWLIDFRFLYGVMFKGNVIFWDNFMRIENKRRLRNQKEIATGEPKTIPSKGIWRENDSEITKPHSSTGKWRDDD